MPSLPSPILGFAAFSGAGKTTLLTQLIPLLKQREYRVGVIKHSHHDIEMDQPGKDSYRLRQAGATPVMLVSTLRRTVITELDGGGAFNLQDHLDAFPIQGLDLVLIEGFRDEPYPKIEIHRPSLGKPLMYPEDEHIIAIASDQSLTTTNKIPCLDLNDIGAIANFIIKRFLSTAHA